MAKSCSQPVNLPGARPLMNILFWYKTIWLMQILYISMSTLHYLNQHACSNLALYKTFMQLSTRGCILYTCDVGSYQFWEIHFIWAPHSKLDILPLHGKPLKFSFCDSTCCNIWKLQAELIPPTQNFIQEVHLWDWIIRYIIIIIVVVVVVVVVVINVVLELW